MATNNRVVANELLDLAGDILRRSGEGIPVDGVVVGARLDQIKGMLGSASDDEIERESGNFRVSGGGGAGP